MPKRDKKLTPEEEEEEIAEAEEEATIEKYEKLDEKALEEATEKPEEIDPDEQLRQQKKRIYDKIEAQVNLSDFWQEVLLNPEWSNVLRVYYRICAGLVEKHYSSFTVSAKIVNGNVVWIYSFYDKDGKELNYDALNEERKPE